MVKTISNSRHSSHQLGPVRTAPKSPRSCAPEHVSRPVWPFMVVGYGGVQAPEAGKGKDPA